MEFHRPKGLLAGFHASLPDNQVPELEHVGEQWAPVEFSISEHSHRVWEFYFQIAGESQWDGAGKTYVLQPGGFFAAGPGIVHRMRERPKSRHHFFFAAVDLNQIWTRNEELRDYWLNRTIIFEPFGDAIQAPFRQLIREVTTQLPHRSMAIRTALDCLVIEATRLLENEYETFSLIASHPAVIRAKDILDHHPAEDWKLADLARLAGLSANHLTVCFTRDIGMSPHQYLLRIRIERAKEALKQSDVPVTELALDSGFSSSQHFASTFKRIAGVTAQAFRKGARPQ